MEKVLVTGATGFIGSKLAMALAKKGYQVEALYRDISKTSLLQHPNINLVKGDLFSLDVLYDTLCGCDGFFHTAACAKLWLANKDEYRKTNVEGTQNVIDAAIKSRVRRGVFTSSAGVLGPSSGPLVTENQWRQVPFFNQYEQTKAAADALVRAIAPTLMETVIVYPTRVYGPGMLNESNGVTRMVQQYLQGQWHTIPGNGRSIGNYVFIDDVVSGLIQAYRFGKPGQAYILAGDNLSYNDFFERLALHSSTRYRMMKIPTWLIYGIACAMLAITKVTGRPPLLTPDLAKKFLYNWNTSCDKAKADLGYRPTSFDEGLALTIKWLREATSHTQAT